MDNTLTTKLYPYSGTDAKVIELRKNLFTKSNERFNVVPPKYPFFRKWYKLHQSGDWRAEEIDLDDDVKHWEKLNDDEKHFITTVLAFFSASDGIVGENLLERFGIEVQDSWARAFYIIQAYFETIHAETYGNILEHLIKDKKQLHTLLNAIDTIPCVKRKATWALKWIEDKEATFEQRLLAFAAVEGIFFSSSFCSIFWLAKRGLMPGLRFSNELISRDEGIHRDFACDLLKRLGSPLPTQMVHDLIDDAVQCELYFVKSALRVKLIGMNEALMCQYVKFTADHLIKSCGYPPLYNVKNPFDWMDMISLKSKSNMFEGRVAAYRKANHKAWKGMSAKEVFNEDRVF